MTPTQDMVIGAYYLTELVAGAKGEGRVFRHLHELERAFEEGTLDLHAEIEYRGAVAGDEGAVRRRPTVACCSTRCCPPISTS